MRGSGLAEVLFSHSDDDGGRSGLFPWPRAHLSTPAHLVPDPMSTRSLAFQLPARSTDVGVLARRNRARVRLCSSYGFLESNCNRLSYRRDALHSPRIWLPPPSCTESRSSNQSANLSMDDVSYFLTWPVPDSRPQLMDAMQSAA